MTEITEVSRLRWQFARFCYEHIGSEDFPELCRTLRIPLKEAKRLALEFAHG